MFQNINIPTSEHIKIDAKENFSLNADKSLALTNLDISMVALQSMLWFVNKNETFYPTLAKLIFGSSTANIIQDITTKFHSSTQPIDCSYHTFNSFQQTCLGSPNCNETILKNLDLLKSLIWDIYHKVLFVLPWNENTEFDFNNCNPQNLMEENTIVMYYDTHFDFFGPIIRK